MNSLSHVAIIMDGNGRWAFKRNKSRNYGHEKGVNNIKNIIGVCKKKKPGHSDAEPAAHISMLRNHHGEDHFFVHS